MDPLCIFAIIVQAAVILFAITWFIYHEIDYRRSIPLSTIPDKPKPFGYKMYWYALRTDQTQDVIEVFNLKNPRPINWEYGVKTHGSRRYRYQRYKKGGLAIFVSPPVCGWTLVFGNWLPYLTNDDTSDAYRLFLSMSTLFGEAQFFDSVRSVDSYTWAKAIQGKLVRAYSFGQDEKYMWDKGELTKAEVDLGFILPTPDNYLNEKVQWKWPNEGDVLQIAGEWSVNPGELDKYEAPKALGVLCDPPK